ncbi:MAG: hypothetical protein ACYC3I_27980 [Gemmataceae bacterium]
MTVSITQGKVQEDQLRAHLSAFQRGPTAGGRQRPIIWGITNQDNLVSDMTVNLFLDFAGRILKQ